MAKQSEHLTRFYEAYLAWAEGGGNPYRFNERYGLCTNADKFDAKRVNDVGGISAFWEMNMQLREAGLVGPYPFEGEAEYIRSADKRTCKARMDWVRARIAKGRMTWN